MSDKDARYARTDKGKARRLRYDRSEKGRAVIARRNARRVFGASGFLGLAPTPEAAADLTNQGREFRDRQNTRRALRTLRNPSFPRHFAA